MKNTLIKIIVALGLISLTSAPLTASANHGFTAHSNGTLLSLPVPTERAIPTVPDALIGTLVRIELTVTEAGSATGVEASQPFSIVGTTEMEKQFLADLTDYVSAWTFEPATDANGLPVSAEVVMPVRIIKNNGKQLAQVFVIVDDRPGNLSS